MLRARLTSLTLSTGLLLFLTGACVSVGSETEKSLQEASADKADEASPSERQHRLGELRFAVELARRELEIEELQAEARRTEAADALRRAEFEREEAAKRLARFTEKERPLRVATERLSLDRETYRSEEAEAELAELETMYAAEEFAESTKELVIQRSRRMLQLSRRQMELAQERLDLLAEFELTAEEREHRMELEEAEGKLARARADLRTTEKELELGLLQKRHALEEAQRELDEELGESSE